MRIYAKDQEQAQSFADRAHQYLIANSISYAQSVASGQTTAWSIPTHDWVVNEEGERVLDAKGEPIPAGDWYILLEDRVIPAFTADELLNTTPLYEAPKEMV